MAALLTAAGNGTGTGASHTGPASVFVRGTFAGASVVVQVSDDNTNYVKADNVSARSVASMRAPGVCNIDCHGAYFIRCVVADGAAGVSVTAVSTQ